MEIVLGERTAETAAIYYRRSRAPAVQRYLHQKARTEEEFLTEFRAAQGPDPRSYGRTIQTGGAYIGDVWCHGIDPRGEPQAIVSYCIFEESQWGRGVATRALGLFLAEVRERLGLERIGAYTYAANAGSIRVLEKNGFHLAETFTEGGVESCYYLRP